MSNQGDGVKYMGRLDQKMYDYILRKDYEAEMSRVMQVCTALMKEQERILKLLNEVDGRCADVIEQHNHLYSIMNLLKQRVDRMVH